MNCNVSYLLSSGGSMRPFIKNGRLLRVLTNPKDYYAGDVVLYEVEGSKQMHRIWAIKGDNLVINDDAAICGVHVINHKQLIGKLDWALNGTKGLLLGILSFTIYKLVRPLKRLIKRNITRAPLSATNMIIKQEIFK